VYWRKKACSFLQESTKNFCELAYTPRDRISKVTKVFWFFFQKRTAFFLAFHSGANTLSPVAADSLGASQGVQYV
jgi:hypothetical protein